MRLTKRNVNYRFEPKALFYSLMDNGMKWRRYYNVQAYKSRISGNGSCLNVKIPKNLATLFVFKLRGRLSFLQNLIFACYTEHSTDGKAVFIGSFGSLF